MGRVVLAVSLLRVDIGVALVMRSKISGCYVLFLLSLCWGERYQLSEVVWVLYCLAVSRSPGFRQFKVCWFSYIYCLYMFSFGFADFAASGELYTSRSNFFVCVLASFQPCS